jgi:imidazolonepropionase
MNLDSLVLYRNISQLLTMEGVRQKKGRHPVEADLGIIENAALVIDADTNRIVWLGTTPDLPVEYQKLPQSLACYGKVMIPELVECHTHLIFAGNRHKDYALRCQGKTYQQVAALGGGIATTLEHTRKATIEELSHRAEGELDRFLSYGVGVVEIKSGYGLTLADEIKILQTVRQLQDHTSIRLVPTFMAAHMTPPEFKGRTDEYVSVVCQEWIPEIARKKLASFFDVFVEEGYFSIAQTRKLAESARLAGLGLKLHVEQFTDLGGTQLAAELGAVSCDHLDHVSDAGVKKLAESDTVAVLLPGASLFTGTPYPPARKLIDAGARIALSTDFNPGTCPSRNLPLMTTLACSQMKMTIPEALAAVTQNAAAALGLEDEAGYLAVGRPFRVCQFEAGSYEALPYCFGELV